MADYFSPFFLATPVPACWTVSNNSHLGPAFSLCRLPCSPFMCLSSFPFFAPLLNVQFSPRSLSLLALAFVLTPRTSEHLLGCESMYSFAFYPYPLSSSQQLVVETIFLTIFFSSLLTPDCNQPGNGPPLFYSEKVSPFPIPSPLRHRWCVRCPPRTFDVNLHVESRAFFRRYESLAVGHPSIFLSLSPRFPQ